jgi:2-hydroxy-4-carboxymuconate semialdehyde hemiacetal dehydrogenase
VLAEGEEVVRVAKESGLVAMCGHTRRFNPSHQYVHNQITAGAFNIQQMDVQTYFFRRTNMNALGQARSWTDHLCGTTPRTRSTCSLTSAARRS